jgi:ATP-dependent DNA helicase RecQ
MRLGYVAQAEGEFPVLELTADGLAVLTTRKPVMLTKPLALPKARRTARREGDVECDEILFSRLRELRKRLADERSVPAYIIFGDTTLRQMARNYPVKIADLDGITGVGEKKRAEFGETFAAAIAEFLKTNPRMTFND